jgi:hypothetical protein
MKRKIKKYLRNDQMPLCIILLTAYMAIGDRDYQIDKRIKWVLFETIHIFNQSISIRARHNCKMGVDQTQW